MSAVRIVLVTPLPRFGNELCDVLKLFFVVEGFAVHGEGATGTPEGTKATPEGTTAIPAGTKATPEAEPLTHTFRQEGGCWHTTFSFRGQTQQRRMDIPQEVDEDTRAIVWKRLQKRLCKLALYDLLKGLTGEHPPWGSLTGIRPTRLLYENLAKGMSLQAGAAALVDSFDVHIEKAELLRRIVWEQQTLPLPAEKEVDVYVSIPFCRTRCAYCSFPGEALGKGGETEKYLSALFFEMEETAKLMQAKELDLRAVYIGGGTPTALSEPDFARLLAKTQACFPAPREFTVEAGRPDTITLGKLQALREYGASRISINPQTMNDKTLALIGRDHTAQQTEEAFHLARDMGFSNINMDVIAGLPGECEADFAHTMEQIRRLAPDSLTVHTLAIKRSSRLNLEKALLPDAGVAARMVEMGEACAAALFMAPYYLYRQKYMAGQQQNVGYARAGAACLYNVDIMEENTSILACGAGAISKRVFPDRELRIERAPNVSNVAVYGERVEEMMERKRELFESV